MNASPTPGSRWVYVYRDGRRSRLTVTRVTGRAVEHAIGGRPAGSICLDTWEAWAASGRLVPERGA